MKILLASRNVGKIKEFQEIFSNTGIEIISLLDVDDNSEVNEKGNTFLENAYLKAKFYYDKYHMAVLADDSGLVIEALKGKPGVKSARFSGKNSTSLKNNLKLLKKMKKKQNRNARFICVLCFISQDGVVHYFNGTLDGQIAYEMKGENGFGYYPLFYIPAFEMTLAEMSFDQKTYLSHRYDACEKLIKFLQKEGH